MNHETQRLLVAASRGARVQTHYHDDRPTWRSTGVIYSHAEDCGIPQRIHPEDTHLQYGPVSTELRRRADGISDTVLTPYAWMADTWVHYCAGMGSITYGKRGNYLWLCAFAAEFAADKGM